MPSPSGALSSLIIEAAAQKGELIATTLNDTDITYGAMNERVNRLAHALWRIGIEKGDRVALLLPNSPTFVMATYAALKIGAVIVNLNVMTQGDELRKVLVDSGARAAVTLDLFLQNLLRAAGGTPLERVLVHSVMGVELPAPADDGPRLHPIMELMAQNPAGEPEAEVGGEDLAVLQYTSGTTGAPKAVALTHGGILSNVLQIERSMPHQAFDNGAVLCIVPFFHVFGMTTCLHLSVRRAYRMVLVPRFDWSSVLSLFELIEKYRPVSFPAVPPLWAALLSHPDVVDVPIGEIKVPSVGGAPLPPWVQQRFHELTGRWLLEAYGLTEASSTTHINALDREPVPGSVGSPLPDTEAKIVDLETGERELPHGEVGELVVRGPQVMRGYWQNQELTDAVLRDGWLHTGDMARRDEAGSYFIVDRVDDLIITSGSNVTPDEVEAVIAGHPGVKEVAVVGIPHPIRGQVVTAVVVAEPETSLNESDLLARCREKLAEFKVPASVLFREELPKSPAGELLRRVLRDELSQPPLKVAPTDAPR